MGLTYWQENKPREISMECNESLLRRLILALGGLPPLLPAPQTTARREPTVSASSTSLAAAEEWSEALSALRKLLLPSPDLTYLCTEGSDRASDSAEPIISGVAGVCSGVGTSFWLDGMLVTSSDACDAYASEARVRQLLRDPLQ